MLSSLVDLPLLAGLISYIHITVSHMLPVYLLPCALSISLHSLAGAAHWGHGDLRGPYLHDGGYRPGCVFCPS
jgi:hypothetical protein